MCKKSCGSIFFIKRITLTMNPILIVLLKLIFKKIWNLKVIGARPNRKMWAPGSSTSDYSITWPSKYFCRLDIRLGRIYCLNLWEYCSWLLAVFIVKSFMLEIFWKTLIRLLLAVNLVGYSCLAYPLYMNNSRRRNTQNKCEQFCR